MAALVTNPFFIFICYLIFTPLQAHTSKLITCENNNNSLKSLNHECNHNASQNQCNTFAVLHTNPYYSSLYNLTHYLGFNPFSIAQENGFSPETKFISQKQPLLIPINCKCSVKTRVFQAELIKTTEKGESFDEIAGSLEGLTTCKAIQEKNPGVSPWNLGKKLKISVPVRCSCPESSSGIRLLVSYAVTSGDSFSSLAKQFNVTPNAIINANKRSYKGSLSFNSIINYDSLSILIPLNEKPILGSLAKPREPSVKADQKNNNNKTKKSKKKKKKRKRIKIGVSIGVVGFVLIASIVGFGGFYVTQRKKTEQEKCEKSAKMVDTELQQLSLSIRTTSEKKVSFEGSQSTLDGQAEAITPRSNANNKMILLESYSFEEIKKATEDFDCHNLIEGKVYHGRIKGKDMAIKCTTLDYISKVDLSLFQDAIIHNHPNILRVLGTCIVDDGKDSLAYLVFEYAKNGSLTDWIHGGLAMKSHFIASCSCFLTWKQRVKICLDVALALQYMHHVMHPLYVHQGINSKNIFLDEDFNAKVGSFGMAKCVEEDEEDANEPKNQTTWNKGYLAPEYIKHGAITPSIDVYAYGVILLEMLSGKNPVMCPKEGQICMISDKIKSILNTENVEELRSWMDNALGENYVFDGAIALATLARACIDENPELRPNAGEIVEQLSKMVEESSETEQTTALMHESSSKPLVQALKI